ncbi:MAG: tyrosine-type recombinase/integrase [Solirubrobacteraceae bacterium]
MTLLAPTLEAFFTERLVAQRRASPNTVAAYRDTFRLLLHFLHDTTGAPPSRLQIEDLDAPTIGAFLDHLEQARGVKVRTRNNRLAAIHSLFRYAALRHPEHAGLIQRVLAIPAKRADRAVISFLDAAEIEALLAAPDRSTRIGRRDHALLALAFQTGLRVSELTHLCCRDVSFGTGANVRCFGKGRKERATPLNQQTAAILRAWLTELGGHPHDPLFPGPSGKPLTRDAVRRIVARHVATTIEAGASLGSKNVTPHVLRHSCAMQLLDSGVDSAVIALWLGHESIRTTDMYQHADLHIKERALARTRPTTSRPGRYRPNDTLLQFLEAL